MEKISKICYNTGMINRKFKAIFLFALILLLSGCTLTPALVNNSVVPITPNSNANKTVNNNASMIKALSGKVTLKSGNCMPIGYEQGSAESTCKSEGVSRKIYIRQPVNVKDMDYTYLKAGINNIVIKTITSSGNGTYETQLPMGEYSVFVEDEGKEFCNYLDGNGFACLVKITDNQGTEFNINIDKAAY
jgi:hypothetical protein